MIVRTPAKCSVDSLSQHFLSGPLLIAMPLDSLQVLCEVCRRLDGLTQVLPVQPLPFVLRKLSSGQQRIPDLPAIHLMRGQFVKPPFQLGHVCVFVRGFLDHVQEVTPNGPSGLLGKIVVMDCNLYSRLERLVESADTIRSQNEYAIVVFERAEKD